MLQIDQYLHSGLGEKVCKPLSISQSSLEQDSILRDFKALLKSRDPGFYPISGFLNQ